MRVTVSAVGRLRAGPEKLLVESYSTRIRQMGPAVGLAPLSLIEVEVKKRLEGAELVEHEAALLRAHCTADARVIALDEHGETWSSQRFAKSLADWRDQGAAETVFVIGGHHGLDPSLRRDAVVSFGRLTWPHLLVRVMLLEQIFRAITILSGHPYHRAGIERSL
jgi:23S rRNA (pseudouridine1915-N3)-methyltransferase